MGDGCLDYPPAPELNPAVSGLLKKNEWIRVALGEGFHAPLHRIGKRLQVFYR
jgi:hypothetical protein